MIILYKCEQCWYVFDEALVRSGKHQVCPCGYKRFIKVSPTWWNICKYIMFQKKHAIKRMMEKEHVS